MSPIWPFDIDVSADYPLILSHDQPNRIDSYLWWRQSRLCIINDHYELLSLMMLSKAFLIFFRMYCAFHKSKGEHVWETISRSILVQIVHFWAHSISTLELLIFGFGGSYPQKVHESRFKIAQSDSSLLLSKFRQLVCVLELNYFIVIQRSLTSYLFG